MTINFRIEYGSAPIRHIAVQCPHCGRWFHGSDITENSLLYDYEIKMAEFKCPVCDTKFSCYNSHNYDVEVCDAHAAECWSAEEVYAGCLTRKEVWE